jgi:hypothetical protein
MTLGPFISSAPVCQPTHRLEEQRSIPDPAFVFHPGRQFLESEFNLTEDRENLFISSSTLGPVMGFVAYLGHCGIELSPIQILPQTFLYLCFIIFDHICQLLEVIRPVFYSLGST